MLDLASSLEGRQIEATLLASCTLTGGCSSAVSDFSPAVVILYFRLNAFEGVLAGFLPKLALPAGRLTAVIPTPALPVAMARFVGDFALT